MTQEALAARAKLNRSYITDVERGARNIALVNAARLVRALDMTMMEFFRKYDLEGCD